MEPGSANYTVRLNALKYLHDQGCKTWVSVEPYPTPNVIEQDLDELLDKISFTDKIIFGRTNYNKKISAYSGVSEFYNKMAQKVIDFCKDRKIAWHIKTGTITPESV